MLTERNIFLSRKKMLLNQLELINFGNVLLNRISKCSKVRDSLTKARASEKATSEVMMTVSEKLKINDHSHTRF